LRRDPEFAEKMAQVLGVYRKVKMLKKAAAAAKRKPDDAVAIISYDEKPGIQAIANTSPDLPPQPGVHASFSRDHEYKRKGTMSLLPRVDHFRQSYRAREGAPVGGGARRTGAAAGVAGVELAGRLARPGVAKND
jgi:hypothetical protein